MLSRAAPLAVAIERLPHARDLALPAYATASSAGMDLLAALGRAVEIEPGGRARLPTGIAIALPHGYEGQVRARSGLAAEHGLAVLNSPGTIDADYRGEIVVILANLGTERVSIRRGMRIAQLVVAPVVRVAWDEMARLPASVRGTAGFGSTGTDTP